MAVVGLNLQHLLFDTLLTTGHVECCAIFRKKDGNVKAASMGYEVSSFLECFGISHPTTGFPLP